MLYIPVHSVACVDLYAIDIPLLSVNVFSLWESGHVSESNLAYTIVKLWPKVFQYREGRKFYLKISCVCKILSTQILKCNACEEE